MAEWDKEAANLTKMNSHNSPNIVKFITAFRQGDTGSQMYYLMFEWADGGHLRLMARSSVTEI